MPSARGGPSRGGTVRLEDNGKAVFVLARMQEDEKLVETLSRLGKGSWTAIAKCIPGRNGKSCRLR